MEYIFGRSTRHSDERMILKTKGDSHSHLGGSFELEEVYPDSRITTRCEIVRRYKSDEDAEGNCYDWYTINNYERHVDLSDSERGALSSEIDELTAYCGELVEEVYEADMEFIIGE